MSTLPLPRSTAPRRGMQPNHRPWQPYALRLKRALDLALVMLSAPLTLPLALFAVVAVWLEGGAPIFGHTRIGAGGRPFVCWKLRTMVGDADARLDALLARDPAAAAEWAETRKLRNDPRITWVGRILRKFSIDEIPQLWNVVRGEMAVVGPRPITAAELATYGAARSAYESVRPGITGLWQVSGRNGLSLRERMVYDVAYRRQLSLGLDLRILLATVVVVLSGHG